LAFVLIVLKNAVYNETVNDPQKEYDVMKHFPIQDDIGMHADMPGDDINEILKRFEQGANLAADYKQLMAYYHCAMLEIETKFKVLNHSFILQQDRNPISSIKTRIKSPTSVLEKLGSTAAPLGLVAMGAMVNFRRASALAKPVAAASFLKLVGFSLVMIPLAVHFGFRAEKLVAILVMLGSATTVAAFTMARGMGHEGALTSATVMATTLLSPVTLAAWLFALKSLSFI
jgi:hypothetical protein